MEKKSFAASCGWRLLAAVALAATMAPARARSAALPESEVRAAVETWVRKVTADARPDAIVERMDPYRVEGGIVAWVAHLQGGGFCLASGDPLLLPVYLYSPHGTYDPRHPGYRIILEEIHHRLEARRRMLERPGMIAALRGSLTERAGQWQALIAGQTPGAGAQALTADPAALVLPLTCKWDQPSPYNDLCPGPPDPSGSEHALVGCNGIATSQLMYYWRWPDQGVGVATDSEVYEYRYRATWDSEPLATDPTIDPLVWSGRLRYIQQTGPAGALGFQAAGWLEMNGYWDATVYEAAQGISGSASYLNALAALWSRMTAGQVTPTTNLGDHAYDWSLLRDIHSDSTTTAAEDAEVAEFCRDVAIAGQAGFGLWRTGGWHKHNANALKTYFRYDPDVLFTDVPPNGPGADPQSLITDIQWGRPAGIGGIPFAKGGHAWVIYGYSTQAPTGTQFMMNFGWHGDSDNWYTLDSCCPTDNAHDMLSRVAPTSVRFVGGSAGGDGSPSSPYEGLAQARDLAPTGATLMLKAGSVNSFTGTVNRHLTLKGFGARVQ